MSAIFVLIGASLVVALSFLFAFIWAVRDGQYDDTATPSFRILPDDSVSAAKGKHDRDGGILH